MIEFEEQDVINFLNKKIPQNFNHYDYLTRITFLRNHDEKSIHIDLKRRETISLDEILHEFLELDTTSLTEYERSCLFQNNRRYIKKVTKILRNIPELIEVGYKNNYCYGPTYTFKILWRD